MIADSKIPEMPFKCTAEVFFPCPAHLTEVIWSWTCSHAPPTFLLLTEVILSWTCSHVPPTLQKLYCRGLVPMPHPPFCCLQKLYCHGLVPCPAHLLLAEFMDLFPGPHPPFCCFQKYIVMDPAQLLLLLWTLFLLLMVWNVRKNWYAIS